MNIRIAVGTKAAIMALVHNKIGGENEIFKILVNKLAMFSWIVFIFVLTVPKISYADTASEGSLGALYILSQNANYIACYKEQADMKMILFRWCLTAFPWTATNESRTSCYVTSEACAEAEMPQSWCIKCGVSN